MLDLVKLKLLGGNGGDGHISLHREKYRPKGGPDGGMGGKGGSIIFVGDKNLNNFHYLSHVHQIEAKKGQKGGKNDKFGKDAADQIVKVPLGTVIWLIKENKTSFLRRKLSFNHDLLKRKQLRFDRYYQDKNGESQANLNYSDNKLEFVDGVKEKDIDSSLKNIDIKEYTKLKFGEILKHGEKIVVCQGGFGGRGNAFFKSASKTTPLEAERGTFGEKKEVILELKLLADVGLVGFPNAGKSTILAKLTYSKPKIGNYRFTTLVPNLGILSKKKFPFLKKGNDLVLADLPGLIEDSHRGKGLGFNFLRHLSHCKVLLFVLFLDDNLALNQQLTEREKALSLWKSLEKLREEIYSYDKKLIQKNYSILINKIDLYGEDLINEINKLFVQEKKQKNLFFTSGLSTIGLDKLVKFLEKVNI